MIFPLPDYSKTISIDSMPFTAPDNGIVYLIVGGETYGGREFYINGSSVIGRSFNDKDFKSTITLILSKNDVLTSNADIYGIYNFVPFKK